MVGFRAGHHWPALSDIEQRVCICNPSNENRQTKMTGLISPRYRGPKRTGVMLLGVDLTDAREEAFVRMVTDGLPLGQAFARAGFKSSDNAAPSKLFALPRVQERAAAILEARRTTGAVSLGEVTSMLQRVYAGAHAAEEYSAAHNAALSLARIYGHITDKATLEVIRRPSRDPDAPSEQDLAAWVESLPPLNAQDRPGNREIAAPAVAPAAPLEQPSQPPQGKPSYFNGLALDRTDDAHDTHDDTMRVIHTRDRELRNDIKGLATPGPSENGAPLAPVTGTPTARAHSSLLGGARTAVLGGVRKTNPQGKEGTRPQGGKGKRSLLKKQVPVPKKRAIKRKLRPRIPSAKDLFG